MGNGKASVINIDRLDNYIDLDRYPIHDLDGSRSTSTSTCEAVSHTHERQRANDGLFLRSSVTLALQRWPHSANT
jgi:hypothetical protein